MESKGTLLITRREVAALLSVEECLDAVEQAFRLHAEGLSLPPGVLGIPARDGGFHIKAAGLKLARRTYFAVKVNGNFFHNVERFAMPRIQGVVVLCDGENGYPLALMDSMEITILRTAAATAVAAKHLARIDSTVATICGCGNQGRAHLRALVHVRPIKRVYAFDNALAQARRFADELSDELQVEIEAIHDLAKAVAKSDICITCTPSKQFFLKRQDVTPGTFIGAVGADSPEKQELEPALMRSGKIVVDLLEQCAAIGDLHHALEAGAVTEADVYAELGEIVTGRKPGRASAEETIIFDSTGTALQDVVAAAAVYEKAIGGGSGRLLNFAD